MQSIGDLSLLIPDSLIPIKSESVFVRRPTLVGQRPVKSLSSLSVCPSDSLVLEFMILFQF